MIKNDKIAILSLMYDLLALMHVKDKILKMIEVTGLFIVITKELYNPSWLTFFLYFSNFLPYNHTYIFVNGWRHIRYRVKYISDSYYLSQMKLYSLTVLLKFLVQTRKICSCILISYKALNQIVIWIIEKGEKCEWKKTIKILLKRKVCFVVYLQQKCCHAMEIKTSLALNIIRLLVNYPIMIGLLFGAFVIQLYF